MPTRFSKQSTDGKVHEIRFDDNQCIGYYIDDVEHYEIIYRNKHFTLTPYRRYWLRLFGFYEVTK